MRSMEGVVVPLEEVGNGCVRGLCHQAVDLGAYIIIGRSPTSDLWLLLIAGLVGCHVGLSY